MTQNETATITIRLSRPLHEAVGRHGVAAGVLRSEEEAAAEKMVEVQL